jgi:Na+-translocating ferredoxin:NAD+ oxidoreductase RNF subunit RnfB
VDRAPGRPKAVINPKCTGCQKCVAACLFKAIEGEPGAQHRVIADKCVGCGRCLPACEFKAIDLVGALGHSSRRS